jgi:hypothetical protein
MAKEGWYRCAKRKRSFNLGKALRYCKPTQCPYLKFRRKK